MALDFLVASLMTFTFTVLSALYLRNIIGQYKPGLSRLLLYIPILILNFCVPLLFTLESLLVFGRITWTFLVAWLATNKGLGFCFNRGVLVPTNQGDTNWSNAQFAALYILPVLPSEERVEDGLEKLKEVGRLSLHSIFKLGMLLLCFALMEPEKSAFLKNTLANGFGLYFFLAYLFDTTSVIALLFFDIKTTDNFNYPFLATSMGDFWGRRWNMMTARILRTLSYDMIIDGAFVNSIEDQSNRKRASETRRALGIIAVFTLSGLIHEAYLWSLGGDIECQWMLYFVIQAPLLLLEKQMKIFMESRGVKSIPKPISIAVFFVFNVIMGALLFVPQARRAGSDELSLLVKSAIFGN